MEPVRSLSNPRVKEVRQLLTGKGRRTTGRALAEGPHVVSALVASGIRPSLLVTVDEGTFADVHCDRLIVTHEVLASLSDTETPQGPIAVFDIPPGRAIRLQNSVVMVDISDPGNVGTIIRSAAAFGFDVVVTGATADVWNPKVVRSSAGAIFAVRIATTPDPVGACREVGLSTIAAVVQGGAAPGPIARPAALLIGSEAHGLPPAMAEESDLTLTIPTATRVESLNAGVAASIAMYAISEGRG